MGGAAGYGLARRRVSRCECRHSVCGGASCLWRGERTYGPISGFVLLRGIPCVGAVPAPALIFMNAAAVAGAITVEGHAAAGDSACCTLMDAQLAAMATEIPVMGRGLSEPGARRAAAECPLRR